MFHAKRSNFFAEFFREWKRACERLILEIVVPFLTAFGRPRIALLNHVSHETECDVAHRSARVAGCDGDVAWIGVREMSTTAGDRFRVDADLYILMAIIAG